ncbi:hypothetical protein OESDEN_20409 [Oesophagostomum dentatum]|uniref:Uncharacterized protein n=1 Tax=Oesophagostomum dentatum TaxID=61180 RepID=A0A0B1S4R5_OESDE|nr:hypothetical protein OESDEN_20409 [Oesophagostomum dentatum]
MFRYLLLLILAQVYASPAKYTYPYPAVVAFEVDGPYNNTDGYLYIAFEEVLSDYFKQVKQEFYPIYNKSFERLSLDYYLGRPIVTFWTTGINCLLLQDYLMRRTQFKQNPWSVYVKCGRMLFSLCYAPACSPTSQDFMYVQALK